MRAARELVIGRAFAEKRQQRRSGAKGGEGAAGHRALKVAGDARPLRALALPPAHEAVDERALSDVREAHDGHADRPPLEPLL